MGAGIVYRSHGGTLSLYEDAAVLMHQSTVHKDRRLHQGLHDFYILCLLPLCIGLGFGGSQTEEFLVIKYLLYTFQPASFGFEDAGGAR